MTELSKHSKLVDSSGIRKAFALAAKLKNPVNLSIGQPDFKLPNELKLALIKSVEDNQTIYTQTSGNIKLIEELKSHLEEEKDVDFGKNNIMITSGASGGIDLIFRSIIDKDDEIIIPDPYFVMYKYLVLLNGGKPVFIDTYPNFRINLEELKSKITDKTKAIFINSPTNPTGIVYTEKEVIEITKIAKEKNILIISDEIYEDYVFNGETNSSPLSFYENTVVLNGFSKSLGITGLRLGYAYGVKEVIDEMIKLQQFTYVCPSSLAQDAVVDFVSNKPKAMYDAVERYKENAHYIYEELKDCYELNPIEGAFYAFIKIPEKYKTTEDFVKETVANNLLIVPGNVFSEKDSHFRVSFACDKKTIESGVAILKSLA